MRAQRLLGLAAALAFTVSGCVTVHGENARVPGLTRTEAAEVVEDYVTLSNRANARLDVKLAARQETGVLGEVNQATLKAARAKGPDKRRYQPFRLSDTRYLIPELRGWPKWFVVDAANNRDGKRWLLAFSRTSTAEEWKAAYLTAVDPGEMPKVVIDEDGYAEPVPDGDRSLAIPPGRLSGAYARYLKDGGGPFARGPHTTGLRKERDRHKKTLKYVTEYVDQAAPAAGYPPFALRTADGGALVLFTTRHGWKVTAATGVPLPPPGELTKALMSGAPKRSLTRLGLAEQTAVIGGGHEGRVWIVGRILGIIRARGG